MIIFKLVDTICEWVADWRAMGLTVHRAYVQTLILTIVLQFSTFSEDFKASESRLDGCFYRHEFSLRMSTALSRLEDTSLFSAYSHVCLLLTGWISPNTVFPT